LNFIDRRLEIFIFLSSKILEQFYIERLNIILYVAVKQLISMIKTTILKDFLLSQVPELNEVVVDRFSHFVSQHKLNWFTDEYGEGVYFLLDDIAKIEGLNRQKLLESWRKFKEDHSIKNTPISPTFYSLTGKKIKALSTRRPDLKITKSRFKLDICNWTFLYVFKIHHEFPSPETVKCRYNLSKKKIQSQLVGIAGYTKHPFCQEQTVNNAMPNPIKTRRFDLVRKIGKDIWIYDLNPRVLQVSDITNKIAKKSYIELAQSHYCSQITFCFVAEGITSEASRLIRSIGKVHFMTIKKLAQNLKDDILGDTPNSETEFYEREVFPYYSILS